MNYADPIGTSRARLDLVTITYKATDGTTRDHGFWVDDYAKRVASGDLDQYLEGRAVPKLQRNWRPEFTEAGRRVEPMVLRNGHYVPLTTRKPGRIARWSTAHPEQLVGAGIAVVSGTLASLKLAGVLAWPWWAITAPLWGAAIAAAAIAVGVFLALATWGKIAAQADEGTPGDDTAA